MKICWDNLEKYRVWYYAKTGTFRVFKGSQWKTYVYHEACLKCGEPFLNPKKMDRFCCGSCANSYTNIKNGTTWNHEKSRETKLKKYGDENFNNSKKASQTRKNFSDERKQEIQLKKEETWIETYGTTNPNKSRVVREKVEETNLNRYGSKCSWGNKEVHKKCLETTKKNFGIEDDSITNVGQIPQIKEKIIETNLERHGVKCVFSLAKFRNVKKATESRRRLWENASDEYKQGYADRTHLMWKGFSEEKKKRINLKRSLSWKEKSPEEINSIMNKVYATKKKNGSWGCSKTSQIFFWQLYEMLPNELKEECYFYELNKEFYTEYCFLDFKVGNCVIEFNGDRWHANPEKYGPEDRPRPYKEHNLTSQEIWDKDKEREERLKNDGYELLVVWASHAKLNKENELQRCLNFILNLYKYN